MSPRDDTRRFESLAQLGQAVSASLELPAVLDAVVAAALEMVTGASVTIWVRDGDRLRQAAGTAVRYPESQERTREVAFGQDVVGRIARDREPLVIDHVCGDGIVDDNPDGAEIVASFMGLPIVSTDRVVGVLTVSTHTRHPFTLEEIGVLSAIADQAALAIENAGLYAAVNLRAQRLAALTRVNQLISASLDSDRVLHEIAGAAAQLMDAPLAAFFRADEQTRTLELAAFTGPMMEDFPLRTLGYDQGIVGWLAANQEMVNVPDVFADGRFAALEWWTRHGLRTFCGMPVTLDGELLAVLVLHGSKPFRVDKDDEDCLQSFVAQAAVAIRNARLYAESERRRRAAEALAGIGRALAQSLDPEVVGRRIAESVFTVVGGRMAALYRIDRASGDFVFVAGASGAGPNNGGWHGRLAAGHGAVGVAVRTRRPFASPNIVEDARVTLDHPERLRVAAARHHAILAVPLVVNDQAIGALAVGDAAGRVFDVEEMRLAQAFADQAALALDNARLLHESRSRQAQLEELLDVNRQLSEIQSLPGLLDRIAAACGRLLKSNSVGFRLREGDELVASATFGDAAEMMSRPRLKLFESLSGLIAATGEPIVSGDLGNDDRLLAEDRARAREAGYNMFLGVPVKIGERVAGVLNIRRREEPFSTEEVALATAFAAQAAVAIENARLFGARREEAEISIGLLRLIRALESARDVEALVDAVARLAAELLQLSRCGVFLAEPDGTLVPVVAAGFATEHQEAFERLRGRPTIAAAVEAAARLEAVVVENALDGRWVPLGVAAALDIRSMLVLPLASGGRLLGILAVDTPGQARRFTDKQIALARGIATHAAGALDRMFLNVESERRRREAEVFAELARTINATLDVEAVLQSVAEWAKELCWSDLAAIALRDPASGTMAAYRHWVGFEPDTTLRIDPGKGVSGQVLVTGRPFRTDNYPEDARIVTDDSAHVHAYGVIAKLVVPIRIGDEIEGLISVANRRRHPFSDRDEAILVRLAAHAAIALQNSQLFAREQAARKGLLESQHFLQSTLDALAANIAVLDESGTIVAVNDAWRRFAADNGLRDADGGLGVDYLAVCDAAVGGGAEEAREVAGALRDIIAGRRDDFYLEYACHGPRAQRWFILRLTRFPGAGPVRVVVAHSDVTERRLAENALREHEAQLRQMQKMEAVGRLAGGVAHDFNNLLTVIIGRSQLVLRRLREADPMQRDVALIQKTAERASALTRQLLAFSRKQLLQPQVVDLDAVVRDLAPMLERLLGEDIDLAVRSADGPVTVKADPGQIEQVIVNLAVNARDAMPRGGRLTIQMSREYVDAAAVERGDATEVGLHAVLAVIDSGAGMTPEVRSRVFEPFFTTKPQGRGTGLGLSTVYGIIQQHQGGVTVESEPGRGTTFRVFLPLTDEPLDLGASALGLATPAGSETVLLLEDEDEVRVLARDILRQNGYVLLEAANSVEALEICQTYPAPIHLLVTDVVMPHMSGREVAEHAERIRPGLKVLYMSGYTDDVLEPHALLTPALTLLQKPFTPEDLARMVRRVLDTVPALSIT